MQFLLFLATVLVPALSARLPYIVSGRDATPGQWPWQASLQLYKIHFCGASLISGHWLVSAAHCVGHSASAYSIIMGAHDIETQNKGAPTRYSIVRTIIHPNYSPGRSFPNDIVLINIHQNANTNSQYISTITIGNQGDNFVGNDNCWITGWGAIYGGGPEPNNLQEQRVDVWSDSQCRRYVKQKGGYHVCVAKSKGTACHGDSGGPLVCHQGGQWKLLGTASFVFGSCRTNYPSVYTYVPYFRDWIRSNTGV